MLYTSYNEYRMNYALYKSNQTYRSLPEYQRSTITFVRKHCASAIFIVLFPIDEKVKKKKVTK